MKASELRIGNLVKWGSNYGPIKSIHTESVLKNEVRFNWRRIKNRIMTKTERLYKNSEYYPTILRDVSDGEVSLSTIVRIQRDGAWYAIHVVETYARVTGCEEVLMYRRLAEYVYQIQVGHKLTENDKKDVIQCSEIERLGL